jgi:trigger factor
LQWEVTEAHVQERIDQARTQSAKYTKVDRPAAIGDVLDIELTITPEGASEPGPVREAAIEIGDKNNLPTIDENVIGLKAGDDKGFQLTYPDDYAEKDVAGQTAGFYVVVKEVQEKTLPALDDDFAKSQGAASVDELRAKVRARLEESMVDMGKNFLETQLLDKLVSTSQIDYPKVLSDREVAGEVDGLLERLKANHVTLDEYLEQIGKTEDELISDVTVRADARIRRFLVIGEVASRENLAATEEDIDAEIAARAVRQGVNADVMRGYLQSTEQLQGLGQSLTAKKVLGFIASSAIISERALKLEDTGGPESAETSETPAETRKTGSRSRKAKAAASEPVE